MASGHTRGEFPPPARFEQVKERTAGDGTAQPTAWHRSHYRSAPLAGSGAAPADLPDRVRDSGFRLLPIDSTHAIAAGRLPPIHRDPFDRMLVAQARCEGLTLVTRDPHCQQYEVAILPA